MFDKFNDTITELMGTVALSDCNTNEFWEMTNKLQEVKEIWNRQPRDIIKVPSVDEKGDESND